MTMLTILQIQPGVILLIGLAVMVVLSVFLWPKRGVLALITKLVRNNKRVLVEDALKFIFDCEYNKSICDINSIAGHLNISMDKAGRQHRRASEYNHRQGRAAVRAPDCNGTGCHR